VRSALSGERELDRVGLFAGECEQQMLGGDVVVLEGVGLFEGGVEDAVERVGYAGLRGGALHLGQAGDGGVDGGGERGHVDADLFKDRENDALLVLEERGHQVHGEHLGVAVFGGCTLRGLQGLLRLECELIPLDGHVRVLPCGGFCVTGCVVRGR
jgi:hypothetical protein